tara:strand:- start:427 stop:642 length:216 start_codon:yes stop_codon:yes gene_type:complete
MIDKKSAKLLDECTNGQWRDFVRPEKIEDNYIYGVQCGGKDCYACATQRYNCNELNKLDKLEDEKNVRTTS